MAHVIPHAGVPAIDPDQHRLVVHGLVREPRLFTMDRLVRFPSESRVHFLECSGNTGNEWNGPSGLPVQFTHGLLYMPNRDGFVPDPRPGAL